ncbi:hypothetical protein AB0B78_01080 [Streptomyces sp. NPDC040724]|uniref:hypothetical protein n=1 Tax=Streptomyces sp. NPDC040724 TaxID=3155612 RepID=UPI0033E89A09
MPDVNALLDRLATDPEFQARWEVDPDSVLGEFDLTESQRAALASGDVDSLIDEGLAERHVQQMRVSW